MDKKTLYGQTSLHTAAIEGDVEIITNLIECKSNINEQDLSKKGLHLNERGNKKMAGNIIALIKRL